MQARQHHYLPASYLAGFADPVALRRTGKQVVYVYEPGKPIRGANPRKEARMRDLYTLRNHPEPDMAEAHLSTIEAAGIAAIRSIKLGERLFSSEERDALAQFMGVMFTRTPAAMEYSEKITGPAAQRLLWRIAQDTEQFSKIWQESVGDWPEAPFAEAARREILGGWYDTHSMENDDVASVLMVGQMAAEAMASLKWQVLRTSQHECFVTSDFPIVGAERVGDGVKLGVGFTHPNSDFYFPLTRSLAVRMAADIEESHGYLPPRGARIINRYLMRYAEKRLFASVRSDRIQTDFERLQGEVRIGVNALVPMWDGEVV